MLFIYVEVWTIFDFKSVSANGREDFDHDSAEYKPSSIVSFIACQLLVKQVLRPVVILIKEEISFFPHSWHKTLIRIIPSREFLHLYALCVIQERTEPSPQSRQAPPQPEPDQEELDFLFDEEMEQMAPRKNKFTDWSDEDDSDYELDDQDVNKILIVTQTPPYLRKHPGGDRTGNHESRAKITTDLAKAINDGLYYYEQDLCKEEEQIECSKVRWKTLRFYLQNDDEAYKHTLCQCKQSRQNQKTTPSKY